jgi:hypothetical protein
MHLDLNRTYRPLPNFKYVLRLLNCDSTQIFVCLKCMYTVQFLHLQYIYVIIIHTHTHKHTHTHTHTHSCTYISNDRAWNFQASKPVSIFSHATLENQTNKQASWHL